MVGCPASGKSHFASKLLCHGEDYVKVIHPEILDPLEFSIDKATKYLLKGNLKIVIDSSNHDVESRKKFIDLAKTFNIPCRVFLMNISKEHAEHNIRVSLNDFLILNTV